jgi:hypothetical protein
MRRLVKFPEESPELPGKKGFFDSARRFAIANRLTPLRMDIDVQLECKSPETDSGFRLLNDVCEISLILDDACQAQPYQPRQRFQRYSPGHAKSRFLIGPMPNSE